VELTVLPKRAKIIRGIREYFWERGFIEVETPLLLPTVSTEPNLEVFATELLNAHGVREKRFLPSSPEYAMKRWLSSGSGSIFQLTRSFRNGEGESWYHSPEFTILEWYEVGGDYQSVVAEMERLFWRLNGGRWLAYQGRRYDLTAPWEKITVKDAFAQVGVSEDELLDLAKLKRCAKKKGYQVERETSWNELFGQILANEIEPNLGRSGPSVLCEYPIMQAALAKACRDPRYVERAEVYIGGIELANIYSELTDPAELLKRMQRELTERKQLGKTEYPLDNELWQAQKRGMPEAGGVAVGVDRLVMLLTDQAKIGQVWGQVDDK